MTERDSAAVGYRTYERDGWEILVGRSAREIVEAAAQLAAFHSKARGAGGKVDVHLCRAADVRKRPGAPAGQVVVRGGEIVKVYVRDPFAEKA
ncbi:MAG: hypothetical protein WD766_03415 [Gemmatimonadota bacterium]